MAQFAEASVGQSLQVVERGTELPCDWGQRCVEVQDTERG